MGSCLHIAGASACLPQPSRLSQQALIHLHPESLASPLLLAQRFLVKKNPSKLQKSSDKQPGWLYSREKSIASIANLGSDMETAVILHAAAEEYLSGDSGAVRHPCSPLLWLCSLPRAGSESPALIHRATACLICCPGHLGGLGGPTPVCSLRATPLPSVPASPAPHPSPWTEVSCPCWDDV